jgi:hypothetical protein
MGPCLSICESTPDVPANIIADPEVGRDARATSANARTRECANARSRECADAHRTRD